MKFRDGKGSEFYAALSSQVGQYFSENEIEKTGNFEGIAKLIGLLIAFILLYTTLLLGHLSKALYLVISISFGVISVLIFFNLVHDSSHNVLFGNKRLNNLVKYMGDVVGVNTYIWHIRHDIQHHSFTKVLGGDLIIENVPIIRLSPYQKHKPIHKLQLYYAPLLYSLYSLYWIFFLDFKFFCKKEIFNLKINKHPNVEWAKLLLFKAFYITYTLVIPLTVLRYNWSFIVVVFLIMHLIIGLLISLVSVLGHEIDGVDFPSVSDNNIINNSWSVHELETTADFASSSKLLSWIIGGLNNHVCHHLFPNICHVHYVKLTPIIKAYCVKHGYKFTSYSLSSSIRAHAKYLKNLSKNPQSRPNCQ